MLRASCVGLACLLACVSVAADEAGSQQSFFIKRNKNSNEVHYDAVIDACRWGDPAVDYYWRELEKGPRVIVDIGFRELPACGFSVDRQSDSEIRMTLNALPDRPISARLAPDATGQCRLAVTTRIDGAPQRLAAVHVHAQENWIGLPTVHSIDILGRADGQPVFERVRTAAGRSAGNAAPASLWTSGAPDLGRRR